MRDHLVIPDSHAQPSVDNARFTWLGQYIVDNQPDVIINIGDMADMKSLSRYDVGKLSGEGRRVSEDLDAFRDAMKKLLQPIEEYNEKQRKNRKKQYTPRMIYCIGNHEHRLDLACQDDPKLYGMLGVQALELESYGWEVVPFLQPIIIDDIAYAHYFPSGVLMQPIGGLNHARKLLTTQFMSATCGHSHLRDFSETTNVEGRRFCGCVVGCYFEHDESWAKNANRMYWRGIVHKHNVAKGQYDPQFIGINELRDAYG